ncbi:MAG: DUF167 domain-containing protein [Chloroflexi bacterium]|nr:DUF167 domain-containing protein [Chloroflexota bacterium]
MARLQVRVQPGASKNEVVGFQDDVLRIKLTAPPVEGKANKALIALLAEILRVSKSSVEIMSGQSARQKVVEIYGLESDEIRARLVGG